jgi:hypothetical protein
MPGVKVSCPTDPFQHCLSSTGFETWLLFRQVDTVCSRPDIKISNLTSTNAKLYSSLDAIVTARLAIVALCKDV